MKYPTLGTTARLTHSVQEKGGFGAAALWLKCHLVAEDHIGFNKVRKWLLSSLSRTQMRKTYSTFLVSKSLDVKLFS